MNLTPTKRQGTVTDPVPRANPTNAPLTQSFAYTSTNVPARTIGKYTARRGDTWAYEYSTIGIFPEGNLAEIRNPLHQSKFSRFDGNRNLDMFNDELSNTWSFTYDSFGNLLTATDPLVHTRTWTYDDLNKVTSLTDATGAFDRLESADQPRDRRRDENAGVAPKHPDDYLAEFVYRVESPVDRGEPLRPPPCRGGNRSPNVLPAVSDRRQLEIQFAR